MATVTVAHAKGRIVRRPWVKTFSVGEYLRAEGISAGQTEQILKDGERTSVGTQVPERDTTIIVAPTPSNG